MILYKWADPVRIKPTDGKLLSVKYSTFACVNKKKKKLVTSNQYH